MSYNNSSTGKKPVSFSLFYGSTQGDAKNTSYPFKRVISSLDKLVEVATCDHVGCRFRSGKNNRGTLIKAYRSNGTFYSADVIIMDVDNVSANPLDPDLTESEWMTPANVAAAFPDVPFYVVYSRHHMQEKNGRSARPKFHVYFPLYREITDYMELEDLKRKVQRMFPVFDPNATKVTQFMFGVSNPKAEYYDGSTRIDQFVRKEETLPEVIQEGHRNETLSKYAGKVITRLGDTKKAREAFDKAADKCCPPLDSEELNGIWRSAQSFFHTTVEKTRGYVEPDDYDETGNSKKKSFGFEEFKTAMANLGIKARFNETVKQTEVSGLPKQNSDTNSGVTLESVMLDYMTKNDLHCTNRAFDAHLARIIDENRYNPVKEMLENTKRDGKDRLTELIEDIMHVKEGEAVYVRKWLHQCIAMALNNNEAGRKPYGADGVLVLQGEQGVGKTMLCSKFAVYDDWFMEGVSIDMGNKDSIIQATSCWIAELGELDSTLKRDQSALKAFLTAKKDVYRMPYAKTSVKQPRRTSFCGTVNPKQFLNDDTGSRRFWVINADDIDTERVEAIDEDWMKQLWRQVYEELYLPNPQGFRLTREERKALQQGNNVYLKPLAGEIEVLDKLDFDAKLEDWKLQRVSQVVDAINAKGVDASKMGKVLAKLAKNDPRVEVKNWSNYKMYRLPPLRKSSYYPAAEDFQPVLTD